LCFLVLSASWQPLSEVQWLVLGFYVLYLLPYVGISYYDRYGLPLLGAKVLMVFWAADRLGPDLSFRDPAAKR
jgi:hypothetical protein